MSDPVHDEIECICYVIAEDGGQGGRLNRVANGLLYCEVVEDRPANSHTASSHAGDRVGVDPPDNGAAGSSTAGHHHVAATRAREDAPGSSYGFGESSWDIDRFTSESDLILELARLVRERDPDILCSFDIMRGGWGYVFARAAQIGLKSADGQTMEASFSRVAHWRHPPPRSDDWGAKTTSDVHVVGRIVLNLWRVVKNEVDLRMYHFENAASKVLRRRYPHFSARTLQRFYLRGGRERHRCVRYWMHRVDANVQFMEALDVIGVNSELARVYGIDFFSVLSRGSQFRVESMLYRLSKPHG